MYTKEEAKAIKLQFWDGFKRYSKKRGRKMTSWVLKGTQIKEVQLKFDLNIEGAFVMLQVDSKLDSSRLSVFESFEKYKPVIDETCGSELIWDKHYFIKGFKEVSVMYYQLKDVSILNQNDWDKCYEFFFNQMILLEGAFLDVKEVVMYKV
jgi:hypothetical protein